MIKASWYPYTLFFRFEAKTSRDTLWERKVWYIVLARAHAPLVTGIGECAPIAGLSIDDPLTFESTLQRLCHALTRATLPATPQTIAPFVCEMVEENYPALRFGLEMALTDLLYDGKHVYAPDPLLPEDALLTNALIWMGKKDFLLRQVAEKVKEGYRCIKMKIDAKDFSVTCALLKHIRKRFGSALCIRLDANGAFSPSEALEKLERLHVFSIHSIEQPIAAGQWEAMQMLIKESPIPIALDEELIGCPPEKIPMLLSQLAPAYLVLKPTLLGSLAITRQWIDHAVRSGIGWWVTSALESNAALYVLAQFVKTYKLTLPHGLGTGKLYKNNLPAPLELHGEYLVGNPVKHWKYPW